MRNSSRTFGEGWCDSYLIEVEHKVKLAYILKCTVKRLYKNLSDVSNKIEHTQFRKVSYLYKI
jgi:hypothetical protein